MHEQSEGQVRAILMGPRFTFHRGQEGFPRALEQIPHPPAALYLVGNPEALREGIAIVGARKATPYGRSCARRFAQRAAERGITVISGGARGCDGEAHKGALQAGGKTVVFLGGGCDVIYPIQHAGLFQNIVDAGGAVVSEHPWDFPPMPYAFRARNRLIAGLSRATLIVEAGLPSGTFSTADEALAAGREVLAVPGAITSLTSQGANRLIYQGATPIVDDDSFDDALFSIFGVMKQEVVTEGRDEAIDEIVAAVRAEPLGESELYELAERLCTTGNPVSWLAEKLIEGERAGLIARYPDGRFGAVVKGGSG